MNFSWNGNGRMCRPACASSDVGTCGSTWSPFISHSFFGALSGRFSHWYPALLVLTLKSNRPWMTNVAARLPRAERRKSRSRQNAARASWYGDA